jgi:hypothetical protein
MVTFILKTFERPNPAVDTRRHIDDLIIEATASLRLSTRPLNVATTSCLGGAQFEKLRKPSGGGV